MAKPCKQKDVALNIISPYPIHKIGNRVFQIGHVDFSLINKTDIIGILDLGLKFIPNSDCSLSDLYYNMINDIDIEMHKLNKKLIMFNKNHNNSAQTHQNVTILTGDAHKEVISNESSNNCDIECIIKKFNKLDKKNNFAKINFDLNPEVLNFRFEMLKELPKIHTKYKSNISLDQFKTLKMFNKIKPFKIIETDKNTEAAILSNETCIELAHVHLQNISTYEKLNCDPTLNTLQTISTQMTELHETFNISKPLLKVLMPTSNNRIGKFRILAKLHKKVFSIRPIINCSNHLTERISIFIDLMLKPIIASSIN